MENLAAPDRAPEKKAFVLVTLAPPQSVMDKINEMDQGARDFALTVWKINNRVITWACPELADRIVPEEREGLQMLLSALEAGTLPEGRIVGPGHGALMFGMNNRSVSAMEVQKIWFDRQLAGAPLKLHILDDFGGRKSETVDLTGKFNIQNTVEAYVHALNATDLTGTIQDRSLSIALETGAEGASAKPRAFRYEV